MTILRKILWLLSGKQKSILLRFKYFHLLIYCSVFDRDNNGYITLDELQRAMQMIGENVTDAQLNEMLALADLDKDGKINYEGRRGTNFVK